MMLEKNISPRCVIFYYEKSTHFIDYKTIEAVKDGIFFNCKYKSGMALFNPPHVIVFANQEPDVTKLMPDRWNITNIEIPGIRNMNKELLDIAESGRTSRISRKVILMDENNDFNVD